jgi:hypothetical protein
MPSFGDTLFAFTGWLRTTFLTDFSLWLSGTSFSLWLQTHFWVIPTLQSIHILSIGALFGSAVMMDMRIYGIAGTSRSMAQTTQRYWPWIWWSFLILLVTGVLLTVAEPVRELINPIFWIKMALLPIAVVLNFLFQAAISRNTVNWDAKPAGHTAIRLGAAGLIILWIAIMFCGRWIAYAPT